MNDRSSAVLGLLIMLGLGLFIGFWFGWDLIWSIVKYSVVAVAIAAIAPSVLSLFHKPPPSDKPRPRKSHV